MAADIERMQVVLVNLISPHLDSGHHQIVVDWRTPLGVSGQGSHYVPDGLLFDFQNLHTFRWEPVENYREIYANYA